MRKAINSAAFIFFIWLVLDAFTIPDKFMYFLIIGELPGTSASLSPTLMLAIMSGLTGLVIFEILARRFEIFRRIRVYVLGAVNRREQLPSRRYTRI